MGLPEVCGAGCLLDFCGAGVDILYIIAYFGGFGDLAKASFDGGFVRFRGWGRR